MAIFPRYGRSFAEVKRGNFWGLPVNFLAFSVVTVVTTSGTLPVFGQMITDPIDTVSRIDNTLAAVLGAFTFVTATIGINIVANFVSPAFDFFQCCAQASAFAPGLYCCGGVDLHHPVESVQLARGDSLHLDMLAAFIGPLFGIPLVDFYLVRKQHIVVEDLYSEHPEGALLVSGWVNRRALYALIPAVLLGIVITLSGAKGVADFNWFIGCGVGALCYYALMKIACGGTAGVGLGARFGLTLKHGPCVKRAIASFKHHGLPVMTGSPWCWCVVWCCSPGSAGDAVYTKPQAFFPAQVHIHRLHRRARRRPCPDCPGGQSAACALRAVHGDVHMIAAVIGLDIVKTAVGGGVQVKRQHADKAFTLIVIGQQLAHLLRVAARLNAAVQIAGDRQAFVERADNRLENRRHAQPGVGLHFRQMLGARPSA